MATSDNFTSFSISLAKLPQQKIAQAISLLLLIYIAFLAAKITWLLVPQAPIASKSTVAVKREYTAEHDVNLSALQALNLFGQYNEPVKTVPEEISDAPETRLKLVLSGVVASDNTETAAAIIAHQGKQETYGVGDVILGTRASLERVLIDRVIIKQLGRLETLMLDGANYNEPAQNIVIENTKHKTNAARDKARVVDQRSNRELTINAKKLRTAISDNPGKITDHLRISPARKDGEVVGYRLTPGQNPDFFKLSGLKSGDVAVQMNGYNLRAPIEAAKALSALRTERDISLLIERKNDLVEILFSID